MRRVGELLTRVGHAAGGVLVLHGAAGMGKTTVLVAARPDSPQVQAISTSAGTQVHRLQGRAPGAVAVRLQDVG